MQNYSLMSKAHYTQTTTRTGSSTTLAAFKLVTVAEGQRRTRRRGLSSGAGIEVHVATTAAETTTNMACCKCIEWRWLQVLKEATSICRRFLCHVYTQQGNAITL